MAPSRHDSIRLDAAAIDIDTRDDKSSRAPDDAREPTTAELGAVPLRGADHGGGERAGG